eukprot:1138618-Pelagomonas_calceolata.AAC.2
MPNGNKLVGIHDRMGMKIASEFIGALVVKSQFNLTSPTSTQEDVCMLPLSRLQLLSRPRVFTYRTGTVYTQNYAIRFKKPSTSGRCPLCGRMEKKEKEGKKGKKAEWTILPQDTYLVGFKFYPDTNPFPSLEAATVQHTNIITRLKNRSSRNPYRNSMVTSHIILDGVAGTNYSDCTIKALVNLGLKRKKLRY